MVLPPELAQLEASTDAELLPLPALFTRVDTVVTRLPELPGASGSQPAAQLLSAAARWAQRCTVLVDAAALFSANEDRDDIATGDLKCGLQTDARATSCLPAC